MSKKTFAAIALSLATPFAVFLSLPLVVHAFFTAIAVSPIVVAYVILHGRHAEAVAALKARG